MARTWQTARKRTRAPPHPIHHPPEEPEQEESEQEEPKHAPEFVEVDSGNNDDDYHGYYGGGWVDTDTEEEPMELPEDHPDVEEDPEEENATGGNGADPDAAGEEDVEEDGDDSGALGGGGSDPGDDIEPAAPAPVPPSEPHYEKQIHHLDFAEGPIPTLLWRAMQKIGFPWMARYEAHLHKNAQQEEEWLVAVVISVPDEKHGTRVEYSKHIDDVPGRTLEVGTSEAARRALYYLCHAYSEELQGTEFRLFP
jgi:hypothetical protein